VYYELPEVCGLPPFYSLPELFAGDFFFITDDSDVDYSALTFPVRAPSKFS
jgi:hypothetical protein